MSVLNRGDGDLQFGTINLTATGDLVSAVPNRKIRVLSFTIVCSAALTVKFTRGTGPTDITGPFTCAANGGVAYAGGLQAPGFETGVNEKLSLNISGTGTVGGFYSYVLV